MGELGQVGDAQVAADEAALKMGDLLAAHVAVDVVVADDGYHGDVLSHGGRQFHTYHHKRSVAQEGDHLPLRVSQPSGHGHAVGTAHDAVVARFQHGRGGAETIAEPLVRRASVGAQDGFAIKHRSHVGQQP